LISALNFIDKNKAAQRGAAGRTEDIVLSGIKVAVQQVLDTEGCAGGPSRSSP
jgi:hypothetical protein